MTLPVFSAFPGPSGTHLIQGEVCGSAFALGSEFMLTAHHVLREAAAGGEYVVVGLQSPEGVWNVARVVETETLAADLALLRVEFAQPGSERWFHRFKWQEVPFEPFALVRAVGYAYGMQNVDGLRSVVVRGFQGHIVSRLVAFKPLGWPGQPFPVYELSFASPRGLSGAPLNSESRMLVFRAQERVRKGAEITTVEQYEALTLGIAVEAGTALPQQSRLLGKSLREHLAEHSLIG
jgi:hypothetical protein